MMHRITTSLLLLSVVFGAQCLTTQAQAQPQIQSANLIKLYTRYCKSGEADMRKRLMAAKIKNRETGEPAALSKQLSCQIEEQNPIIKKLRSAKWVDDTNTFIGSAGVETYVQGTRRAMAESMRRSHVVEMLKQAPKTGLSQEDLLILGRIIREVAFAEAHVRAALALKKK